jgi:hypothetical protein
MDVWRKIECLEVLIAGLYLVKTRKTEKHLTQGLIVGMIGSLLCDLALHLYVSFEKSPALWIALNVFFFWFLYEKFLRKYCLAFYKRIMLALFQCGR